MVAVAPIVTLCLCALVSIAAVVIGSIAFDKALHIPLNYVSPSPASSPSFQTQLGSKLVNNPSDFYPLATETLTYTTPFKALPFLVFDTKSTLSGQPCNNLLVNETNANFIGQIFHCPKNGFIVNNIANTVINPSMASFAVGTENLPAIVYALNQKLYYQLAKDTGGELWNAPVVIADVPLNATTFRLLNVGEKPTVAWTDNTGTGQFTFAQATTVDFAAYAIGPVIVLPGYAMSTNVFDFFYVSGQPAVVIRNSVTNDLNFIRSADGGATWVTSTTIVAATAMASVSMNIVDSFPAVSAVTTLGAMNFYRAATNIGGGPWVATAVYLAGIASANLTLSTITAPSSTEVRPIVWAADANHQFFLMADNTTGTAWTTANEVKVNSTGSNTSQNGHMIVSGSSNLLLSYIDQSYKLQYMVISNSNFSAASNGLNAAQIDPSAVHLDQSSNIALIGGGIAFTYVRNGKLLYFRPPLGSTSVDTTYLMTYTATGSV